MSKLQVGFLLAVVALGSVGSAMAGTCPASGPLRGSYGLSLQGQQVNGPPYAAVGLVTINKDAFTLQLTMSEGGVVTQKTIGGQLEMDDCGLTLSGQGQDLGFMLKGQVANRGKDIFLTEVHLTKPIVASGTMHPLGVRQCKEGTLRGRYTYLTQGYERSPSGGLPWVPVGKVGSGDFNGKGCVTYEESIKQGPASSTGSGALAYKVMENCTVEMIESGRTAFYGVLTDSGHQMLYLQLTDSAVRAGEFQWSGQSQTATGCP